MTTAALSIPKEANPLRGLSDFGQSVWLDYIRRSLITSGELKRLVVEDGLRGVTSNPAIFEKAIVGSTDYEFDATGFGPGCHAESAPRFEHAGTVGKKSAAAQVNQAPVTDPDAVVPPPSSGDYAK